MDIVTFWKEKHNPPKDPKFDFTGKTIIVTGGNSGIGYESALKFTEKGASKVILTSRALEKGQPSKLGIESATGKKGVVEVWELEMGSYDSIRAFVKKAEALKSLDIVVLNAGIMATQFRQSEYGWESVMQVNTLSTTLLALMLLPKMRASKTKEWTPVLEIVSSGLFHSVVIPEDSVSAPLATYNKSENFERQRQYNNTKFFVQCAVRSIAELRQPKGASEPEVIVMSCCPGPCKSSLGREMTSNFIMRGVMSAMFAILFRTAEEGSRTYVSGTIQGKAANGGFWKNDVIQPDPENMMGERGEKLKNTVWSEILDALQKDVPEVTDLAKMNA